MTYTPDYIRLSTNSDMLASGAQRINANFDDIAFEIVASINGLAYQNPVISAASAAPASPELGDRYIVSAFLDESDPWYGHIDEIAEYVDTDTWEFYAPSAGWCCTVLDEGQQFVYNDEQWNPLPVLVTHNDLASLDGGTDGEYYHVTADVHGALAGTGTPTDDNKFVTADSLLTDISTHDHSGVTSTTISYDDLDDVPLAFTPSAHNQNASTIQAGTFPSGTFTFETVALTKSSSCGIVTLTDGDTITPNFADSNFFSLTLGGNRTLNNPTNMTVGQSGVIFLVQDGSGSKTLSYGNYYDFPGGIAPVLSTAASSVDLLSYIVRSSTSICCQLVKAFS